jgi:hypothetical protein
MVPAGTGFHMHQEAEVRIHPEALDHLRDGMTVPPKAEPVAAE